MKQTARTARNCRLFVLLLLITTGLTSLIFSVPVTGDEPVSELRSAIYVRQDRSFKPNSTVAEEAIARNKEKMTGVWYVTWDTTRGLPKTIGGVGAGAFTGDLEDAAIGFVRKHSDVFLGIRPEELGEDYSFIVENKREKKGSTSLLVQSKHKGISIHGSFCGFRFAEGGYIVSIQNFLRPAPTLNLVPNISSTDADQIIATAVGSREVNTEDGELELVIYCSDPPRLAYAGFRKIGLESWFLVIDAHTSEFLVSNALGSINNWRTSGGKGEWQGIPESLQRPLPYTDSLFKPFPLNTPPPPLPSGFFRKGSREIACSF